MLKMALEHSVLCEQAEYKIESSSEYFADLNTDPNNTKPIVLEIEICRIEAGYPAEHEDTDSNASNDKSQVFSSSQISRLTFESATVISEQLKKEGDSQFGK